MSKRRFFYGDITVYIFSFVLIVSSIFVSSFGNDGHLRVEIYQSGELIYDRPLPHTGSYTIYGNYQNEISINGNSVLFLHSNCPSEACVLSGSITHSGQTIACLPNEVVVRIVGMDTELDAVSG